MAEITNPNTDPNKDPNPNTDPNTDPNPNTDPKTYTQEEVLALLQKESDKRVTQALEKQKKKYEQKLSLSGLDEVERTKAEKDMRIQELEEKVKEFNILQNKNEVVKVLAARKLNPAFADVIAIDDDLEAAQKKIETLDKLFKEAVQAEIKTRLNGGTPKTGGSDTGEITAEAFKKMTLAQQSEIYKNNPELWKKLTGRN